MNIDEFTTIRQDNFLTLSDELQEQTIEHAAELVPFSETAKSDDLLSLFIQYRFFTIYSIPDLAILIARLLDGRMRSFLADIWSNRLCNGDPQKAHPHLYYRFLKSIGMPDGTLEKIAIQDNLLAITRVFLLA